MYICSMKRMAVFAGILMMLTLLIVPVFYLALESMRDYLAGRRAARAGAEQPRQQPA